MQEASGEEAAPGDSAVGPIEMLLRKVGALGIDPDAVLRACGLSFTFDDLVDRRITALSQAQCSAIIRWVAENTVDRFGAPADKKMRKRDFDLFCLGCVQCETLEAAISRQIDFLTLMNGSAGRLRLRTRRGIAALECEIFDAAPEWKAFFLFNAFSVFRRLFSYLIGAELEALEFHTIFDSAMLPVARILLPSDPIHFGAGRDEIRFSAAQLSCRVTRGYVELAEFLKRFPYDLTLPDRASRSWEEEVQAQYQAALERGDTPPSAFRLASALGLSTATLRRRLAEQGTSLRAIKDQARRDFALLRLAESESDFEELAIRLGFSCSKAFVRAFKGWTGMTPAAYRRSAHTPAVSARPH